MFLNKPFHCGQTSKAVEKFIHYYNIPPHSPKLLVSLFLCDMSYEIEIFTFESDWACLLCILTYIA